MGASDPYLLVRSILRCGCQVSCLHIGGSNVHMLGDQIIPGSRVWYKPFLAASIDFALFQQSQLQAATGMTSSTKPYIRHVVLVTLA